MTQTVVDEVMLREPRLLVPGVMPVGPVKIDMAHPFANGLIYTFVCTQSMPPVDLLTGRMLSTKTGAPTFDAGTNGKLWKVTANDSSWRTTAWNRPDGDVTMMVMFHRFGNATGPARVGALTYNADASSSPYVVVGLDHTDSSVYRATIAGNTALTLATTGYIGTVVAALTNSGSAGRNRWLLVREGTVERRVEGVITATLSYASDAAIVVGQDYAGSRSPNAGIYMMAIWNRYTPIEQLSALAKDPTCFLIPA